LTFGAFCELLALGLAWAWSPSLNLLGESSFFGDSSFSVALGSFGYIWSNSLSWPWFWLRFLRQLVFA